MSVLTCGGMRAQQSWQRSARVSAASQANVEAVVARALAVGINHFETARGYGTSEPQLGKALAQHPRDAFVLQTKLQPNEDPAAFQAQLEESFARSREEGSELALVLCDLDHFKRINDTHGHPTGDTALRAVAEVLLAPSRGDDLCARMGEYPAGHFDESDVRWVRTQLAPRLSSDD